MAGGLHLGKKATVAQAEGTESHLIKRQVAVVLPLIALLLLNKSIVEIKGRARPEKAENKKGMKRRKI